MGPVPLPCRRHPLRHGHDGLRDPLQTPRRLQYRHRLLYQLALPSLGDQTPLEPLRRHVPDEAVLDRRDAACDRRVLRLRGPHDPGARIRALYPRFFLDHGVQFGHPRHRRRRLLHARPQGVPAGGLHRGADDLLPDRDDRRQGDPRRPGRNPGAARLQRRHGLVGDLFSPCGDHAGAVSLPPFRSALSRRRTGPSPATCPGAAPRLFSGASSSFSGGRISLRSSPFSFSTASPRRSS